MPVLVNLQYPRRPAGRGLSSPILALGLLAASPGCQTLGPPDPLPTGAQLLTPPQEYATWWMQTELCAGRTGDMSRITWYVVPGVSTFDTPDGPRVGVWSHSSEGVRIVVAGLYQGSELVVRHEMLHALLNQEGHPTQYFEDRCQLTWATWGGTGARS